MMVHRGELPFYRLGHGKNGSIRFKADEIQAWVQSKIVEAYAYK